MQKPVMCEIKFKKREVRPNMGLYLTDQLTPYKFRFSFTYGFQTIIFWTKYKVKLYTFWILHH